MKGIVITILIVIASVKLYAQEDTTAKQLDEVFITAGRLLQKKAEVPYTIKTITNTDINRFAVRTTAESMNAVNGVFLQKTNHGGGSAFVRGLTGNQTLILVDGIRLNNSTFRYGPNQYLNTIDVFTVERIEVAEGTGSVQYGTDAMGGVIQIITKEPAFNQKERTKPFGSTTSLKWISRDMEQTIREEITYSNKSFAVIGGLTVSRFGDIVGGDTTGRQAPTGYKQIAGDIKLKWRLQKNVVLIAAHQFLQQKNVPVYHKIVLENYAVNEMDPQRRMLDYAKLLVSTKNKYIQTVEATASFQQTLEGRNSMKNQSQVLRKEKDRVNTSGITIDVTSVISSSWKANWGIEVYNDKVLSNRIDINSVTDAKTVLRGLYPDNSKYGNYSFFVLHHFFLKRITADAGLRYNFFNIRLTDTTTGHVKITPSAVVGNLAVLYKIGENHHLFANYNGGYRAPNIDDMGTLGIVDFRYEIPAADLLPEKSHHYEFGYKYSSNKITASCSIFYMQLMQLITRVKIEGQQMNGYNVYKKENTESAYIRGAEVSFNYSLLSELNIYGGATYIYGQNVTKKEPLRRIPPFNGSLRLNYQKNHLFTAAEFWFAAKQSRLAQGDKDDNRIPSGGTPGFGVINFYAGYKLKQIEINCKLQNLLNRDYRTHGSGINGYGRSLCFNIQFMF